MEKHVDTNFTAHYLIEAWSELAEYLLQHPEKLVSSQLKYWQSYLNLCQELSNNTEPSKDNDVYFDKRFQYIDWQNNLIFNFIKCTYLLLSQHVDNLANDLDDKNEKIVKKFRFFTRQFIDSIAPTNFVNTNPEVLSKTLETNGTNLIDGFKRFQEDLKQGKDLLHINMIDSDSFKLGENIACTPGKVIYQNDLMQLIQYTATTETIYQYPLLIIPPWINKYYILDLRQENSLVKWLVDQGFTVFLISWVNPTPDHKEKEFSDYMFEGPLTALKMINQITGSKKTNILGYCIGGTLLGCMLAYLAQKKRDLNILSATFLTTLFDFSEPGELGTFIDEKQISLLEEYMKKKGYLDGRVLASVFNALRANDLIWSSFVSSYLKGQKPKPFDLLYWNSDSTNIPERVHGFYLRNMYLYNYLIQPGGVKIADVSLDLSKISTPSYFLAAQDDHIVPWKSCYQSQRILKGLVKFVLAGSGHVAGVINPPHKKKYGYWTNNTKHKDAEKFLITATFHEGSWWNDWGKWLKKYSGRLCSANRLYSNAREVLENAPGSYVKVTLSNIAMTEEG